MLLGSKPSFAAALMTLLLHGILANDVLSQDRAPSFNTRATSKVGPPPVIGGTPSIPPKVVIGDLPPLNSAAIVPTQAGSPISAAPVSVAPIVQPPKTVVRESIPHPLLNDPFRDLRDLNRSVSQSVDLGASERPQVWWAPMVTSPLRDQAEPLPVSIDNLIVGALTHSSQIRVFSHLPMIRNTAVIEARSAFDTYKFLDTRWDDISEPTGSTLTAGAGVTRYSNEQLSTGAGLRKRTQSGGVWETRQSLGMQSSNSQFLLPNPQTTGRLSLNFTQPLARGRGKTYNLSLVTLACVDKRVADAEYRRQLQSHLLEVTRAYWALYLERATLCQNLKSFQRGSKIYDLLQQRRHIDATSSQLLAADAAMKQRRSTLIRSQAAVENAESRLRALVNDPALDGRELLPLDQPLHIVDTMSLSESLPVAFDSRPEVTQALSQVKAASIRVGMAKHELLPLLNLTTEAYLNGLGAGGEAARAFSRQFDSGAPSYAIGLQYELPYGNRAAKARLTRRRLECSQLQAQMETTLQTVRLEVEVAVREIETSRQELSTKHASMVARENQLDSLLQYWKRLPGEGATAALALENILTAQERLLQAEGEYLKAQLTYNLALANHKRAIGVLLQDEGIADLH